MVISVILRCIKHLSYPIPVIKYGFWYITPELLSLLTDIIPVTVLFLHHWSSLQLTLIKFHRVVACNLSGYFLFVQIELSRTDGNKNCSMHMDCLAQFFLPFSCLGNKSALVQVRALWRSDKSTISVSSLCKFIWRHWTYKMPVRYILSSVWVRLSIFSPLSIIQYVGLYVFSLPISVVMIEIIYILCLIIIIKSEVWTITHCLGLGHETMVSAVCLSTVLEHNSLPEQW